LRLLGQGAMGKVYLGEDPFIGRQVAIKVLSSEGDEEAHRRFLEEARTVGQLSHPQIVTLLEFGFHESSPFLVMELLKGESLETWLGRQHSLVELLRVLRDLCLAVAHAHFHGVLHRDIKPSNAQVLPDGTCKLMDFGIARSQRMKLTATGMVVGTPQFIAPEVLRDASYTPASDTYAMGLVAYQVLAGQNPFAAGTLEACLTKVLTLTPPPLSSLRADVPAELAELIDASLAKDPEQRPNISHLLHGLERALASAPLYASGGWIANTAMATYALPKESTARQSVAGAQPLATSAWVPPRGKLAIVAAALLVLVSGGLFLVRRPAETAPTPTTVPAQHLEPTLEPTLEPAGKSTEKLDSAAEAPDVQASRSKPAEPSRNAAEEKLTTPPPTRPATPSTGPTSAEPESAKPSKGTAAEVAAGNVAAREASSIALDAAATAPADKPATAKPEPLLPSVPKTVPKAGPSAPMPAEPTNAAPPELLPLLNSLSPTVVRRGSSTLVQLQGERIGKIGKVLIYRGQESASGIEARRIRAAGDGKLTFSLFVDSNARLGLFSLQVVDADGRVSNSLSLEVGL